VSPIANYTTTVPVDRTLVEIQKMLAKAGARRVLTEYDDDGEIAGLSFQVEVGGSLIGFRLPANATGVGRALEADGVMDKYLRPEHVRRVAWRIIRDWLRAQFALIEAQQATLAQVMLPYAITPTGRTLAEEVEERGAHRLLALPSSDEEARS
jgi:hypothetical protein